MKTTQRTTVEIGEGIYMVPMDILLDLVNSPFECAPWDCELFSINSVLDVPYGEECSAPYDYDVQNMVVGQSSYHIARIAYILRHPEKLLLDDFPMFSPSSLDQGIHPLLDGNHRFAAAIIEDAKYFIVEVDGDIDNAEYKFRMPKR